MEADLNIFYASWASEGEHFFESFESRLYIDHLQALKNEIDSFTELGENWDGYGGVALLGSIANNAKHFISIIDDSFVDRITDLFPNPHGTITIEWINENEEKLSLEIGESNYSYFIENRNAKPQFFDGIGLPNLEAFKTHLVALFENELPRLLVLR